MESDNEFFSFKGLDISKRRLRLVLDLPGGLNEDMLLPHRVFGSEASRGRPT